MTAATRWPEARATRGMVASPHRLAAEAGVAILRRGGNAVDAAIAAAAAVAVVYPHMNGVGGDSFWLIFDGRTRRLRALNAAGRSAAAATLEIYQARFGAAIPARGGAAALTVPGAVSGWWAAHLLSRDSLGSPLAWKTLLEEAIAHAREGFPPSPGQRRVTAETADLFGAAAPADLWRTLWCVYHPALLARERFVQAELAGTLAAIAEGGAEEFYRGGVATSFPPPTAPPSASTIRLWTLTACADAVILGIDQSPSRAMKRSDPCWFNASPSRRGASTSAP